MKIIRSHARSGSRENLIENANSSGNLHKLLATLRAHSLTPGYIYTEDKNVCTRESVMWPTR